MGYLPTRWQKTLIPRTSDELPFADCRNSFRKAVWHFVALMSHQQNCDVAVPLSGPRLMVDAHVDAHPVPISPRDQSRATGEADSARCPSAQRRRRRPSKSVSW
jgi:hypothetical protein